jgi:hypothetical protein
MAGKWKVRRGEINKTALEEQGSEEAASGSRVKQTSNAFKNLYMTFSICFIFYRYY